MRSFQVFAGMSDEEAEAFFGRIKDSAPAVFVQSVHAACAALKSRPAFLLKQPFPKQASAVRRALSRVASNPLADETLAMYFLEVRKELLVEWLDTIGIDHEDGSLTQDSPAEPGPEEVRSAVDKFRAIDHDPDRPLLLQAFAAQGSIEWQTLESLLDA